MGQHGILYACAEAGADRTSTVYDAGYAGIETSGPSSQLSGEALYWSFGKMGAP